MIEEEKIYTSSKFQTINPDWCVARKLDIEHGHVTERMIMQRLMVTQSKARKILNRWESMKRAIEIQKRFGSEK